MPLLKAIAEIKEYAMIDANMRFASIKPYIFEAEELFIKPLLGDLYDPFLTDYTDNTDASGGQDPGMSADNKALLPYVQRALVYYSLLLAIDHVGVSVGDMGIQQTMAQNSQPAPRWKVRDLQVQYLTSGDRWADKLLEYLEENAAANKYQQWFDDEAANTKMSGTIVYSTSIASQYIDINESRRVFIRLKKRIKEIERYYIKSIICSDQYEELVTELQAGNVSDPNKSLIAMLEPIIAKKALYLTIPSLRISITDEGITMHSSNDSVVIKSAASKSDVNDLVNNLRKRELNGYEADEDRLRQFIIDNISDYPLIEGSSCWTYQPEDSPKYIPDNDPCNKHFSV